VLEKMREAGSSLFFITRSNIVIKSNGHYGHSVVFAQNNAQTVGKTELCDGCWWEF